MKLLVVLFLATLVIGDSEWQQVYQWQKMKAMESCWGEENMKLYTVNIKRAVAKCSHEDAPELSLPPYKSTYRFVSTLLNGADRMEKRKSDFYEMMNWVMKGGNGYSSYSNDYQRDDNTNNWMDKMRMSFMMKKMMRNMMEESNSPMSYRQNNDYDEDMMKMFRTMFASNTDKMGNQMSNYNKKDPMARMNQLMSMFSKSRSKRSSLQDQDREGRTDNNLDLGDRLVEKLNEKKRFMEEEVGNMTCVMKEMKCLNSDNELDIRAMKEDAKQYTMPSPWFAQRYEELIDACHEMATNLPSAIEENSEVTGESFGTVKLAEIQSFMTCLSKAETQLCMNQDIRNKVVSNFGPMEDILRQTQLTEGQIFPLLRQLLHGEEMKYMMGDY